MALPPDARYTVEEFRNAVNMSPEEVERWVQTPEARSAGDAGEARRIASLLRKPSDQYTDGDVAEMRTVIDSVRQRLTLEHRPERDVEHSAWRYGLMNWGHDPLKDQRH